MKAPYDTAWYSKPKEKSIIFRLQHLFVEVFYFHLPIHKNTVIKMIQTL